MEVKPFFSVSEGDRVLHAIREAEKMTSGEIKVFIEANCPDEVYGRAAAAFEKLGLHNTKERNAVLFYLAHEDHKFAILGDVGINKVVPADFWEDTKELMKRYFSQGEIAEGLFLGILEAGRQLKMHFPYDAANDVNEISDEIILG